MKMIKKILLVTMLPVFFIFLVEAVSAHCPLCTTGAAVGIGFARAYGVDDSIVGLFLGALIISSALWFSKWLKKKINFPLQGTLIVITTFLATAIPFYYAGIITNFEMVKSMPEYHSMFGLGIFGLDRLLIGMIIGALAVYGAFTLSDVIKKERGKVLWPYQGLSFMIITLALLSLVLLTLTRPIL